MFRIRRLTVAALVLAAGLVSAGTASAGPLKDWLWPDDTEAPAYSRLRYWAPGASRIHDYFHGPKLDVYPPDRHPEIAPTFNILNYPAPAAAPGATIIPPPTPPATSKFRY